MSYRKHKNFGYDEDRSYHSNYKPNYRNSKRDYGEETFVPRNSEKRDQRGFKSFEKVSYNEKIYVQKQIPYSCKTESQDRLLAQQVTQLSKEMGTEVGIVQVETFNPMVIAKELSEVEETIGVSSHEKDKSLNIVKEEVSFSTLQKNGTQKVFIKKENNYKKNDTFKSGKNYKDKWDHQETKKFNKTPTAQKGSTQKPYYEKKEDRKNHGENVNRDNQKEEPVQNLKMDQETKEVVIQQVEIREVEIEEEVDEENLAELTALLFQAATNIPGYDEENNEPKFKHKIVYDQNLKPEESKLEKKSSEEKKLPKEKNDKAKDKNTLKKGNNPKRNILKWAVDKFYKIYHYKRYFLHLFKRLEETWEEVFQTLEDEAKTFENLVSTKPFYFTTYSIFVTLLFHLLIEKELFELAIELYNDKKDMIKKAAAFENIVEEAMDDLYHPKNKKILQQAQSPNRELPNFANRLTLSDLGRSREDTIIVDKFEKFGNKFLRIETLEKIKKEEKIAIHYEKNYKHTDSSLIEIATENEIFLIDINRLCHFNDNVLTLVEFFSIILGKRSSVVIVMNAKDLCDSLMESLFIEKEEKDKSFVEAKKELCRTLDKYRINFTDMSVFGLGRNIRELVSNVLGHELDEREKFGNWHKRPLSLSQIAFSEINVSSLYACYNELFEKN